MAIRSCGSTKGWAGSILREKRNNLRGKGEHENGKTERPEQERDDL